MGIHRLIVFTEPTPGRDDEYNRWYDEVHLREVLEVEGFVSAQRFALADAQIGGGDAAPPGRYLAIYDVEADDLEAALEKLNAGSATMEMSDALDMGSAQAFAYSAIGDKRHSA